MTDMEKNFGERITNLEERFKQRYAVPFTVWDGQLCFQARSNRFFLVSGFTFPDGAQVIVLEYANSLEEAKLPRFEDGDLYYMDEMDEEEMFHAMIKEIEDE